MLTMKELREMTKDVPDEAPVMLVILGSCHVGDEIKLHHGFVEHVVASHGDMGPVPERIVGDVSHWINSNHAAVLYSGALLVPDDADD